VLAVGIWGTKPRILEAIAFGVLKATVGPARETAGHHARASVATGMTTARARREGCVTAATR
jgi:hypothetical protein